MLKLCGPFYNLWQKYWIRIILDWYVLQCHMQVTLQTAAFPTLVNFIGEQGAHSSSSPWTGKFVPQHTISWCCSCFCFFRLFLWANKNIWLTIKAIFITCKNEQNPIQICKTQEFKSAVNIFTAWCCQNVIYDSLWMKVTTLVTRGSRILKEIAIHFVGAFPKINPQSA